MTRFSAVTALPAVTRLLAVGLLALSVALSGCDDNKGGGEPTGGDKPSEGGEGGEKPADPVDSALRGKLVSVAAAQACMVKRGKDPASINESMRALYKNYDIPLEMYTQEMAKLANDGDFQKDVAAAIAANCPAGDVAAAEPDAGATVSAKEDAGAAADKEDAGAAAAVEDTGAADKKEDAGTVAAAKDTGPAPKKEDAGAVAVKEDVPPKKEDAGSVAAAPDPGPAPKKEDAGTVAAAPDPGPAPKKEDAGTVAAAADTGPTPSTPDVTKAADPPTKPDAGKTEPVEPPAKKYPEDGKYVGSVSGGGGGYFSMTITKNIPRGASCKIGGKRVGLRGHRSGSKVFLSGRSGRDSVKLNGTLKNGKFSGKWSGVINNKRSSGRVSAKRK